MNFFKIREIFLTSLARHTHGQRLHWKGHGFHSYFSEMQSRSTANSDKNEYVKNIERNTMKMHNIVVNCLELAFGEIVAKNG